MDLSKAFIDGGYMDAASGRTFTSRCPISGESLIELPACGKLDVDRAVAAGRRAFDDGRWQGCPSGERKHILRAFAGQLRAHRDEVAALATIEMGRPIEYSEREVEVAADSIEWFAEALGHPYGEGPPLGALGAAAVSREPLGLVAVITSWDLPLLLPAQQIAPALALGNSVILKPAEQASLAVARLGELASAAGIPAGVLNVLPGAGEVVGEALTVHEEVDGVVFSGTPGVARLVARRAADNLKRVSMDLKAEWPVVVLADTPNLDVAGRTIASRAFRDAGWHRYQGTRVIAPEAIVEELVEGVRSASVLLRAGDPFDRKVAIGPLVDEAHVDCFLDATKERLEGGARIEFGGERILDYTGGFYVEPTLVRDGGHRAGAGSVGFSGPLLAICTFADEDDALRIANLDPHVQTASVWAGDIDRGRGFARRLRANNVRLDGYAEDHLDDCDPDEGHRFVSGRSLRQLDANARHKMTVTALPG